MGTFFRGKFALMKKHPDQWIAQARLIGPSGEEIKSETALSEQEARDVLAILSHRKAETP